MKYRDHRGSLKESMKTVQEFDTANALFDYLRKEYPYLKGEMNVKKYAVDHRIEWDTHLVSIGGTAVGYTDG